MIGFCATISKHLGHFCQANRWSQLSPSGTAPAARHDHTSVWSDVADGMYVFGGMGSGHGLSVNGLRDGRTCRGTPRLRLRLESAAQCLAFFRPPGVGRVEFGSKNSSGGLMRADDLIMSVNYVETSKRLRNIM